MNETDSDLEREPQAWLLRSRDLLQRSADDLDGTSLSRLNQSRQAALRALDAAPQPLNFLRWAGASAITAGMALLLWQALIPTAPSGPVNAPARPTHESSIAQRAPPPADLPVVEPDFELLVDSEDYALMQDLEFYAWLESGTADADG